MRFLAFSMLFAALLPWSGCIEKPVLRPADLGDVHPTEIEKQEHYVADLQADSTDGQSELDGAPELVDLMSSDLPDLLEMVELHVSEVTECTGELCQGCCPAAVGISAGPHHTCALLEGGAVRCWGLGSHGQLGYANTKNIGGPDDLQPADAGEVQVGGPVIQLAAGGSHTCALLDSKDVVCWGDGGSGQLGYSNMDMIGDGEEPVDAGSVEVGGKVKALAAGALHTCAVLENGDVICWGTSSSGRLGYPDSGNIGDSEDPADAGPVQLGAKAIDIAAGTSHTCALMESEDVMCWGANNYGQLGYGHTDSVGDDEHPDSEGIVNIGGKVKSLTAGSFHTCAILVSGDLVCWGYGGAGLLGYSNEKSYGDLLLPSDAGFVNLGGKAKSVSAGLYHTCALLESDDLVCWGDASLGQLGYGDEELIGDNEPPSDAGAVSIGGPAAETSVGDYHSCAALKSGKVRCWGDPANGQLGFPSLEPIGDTELPTDINELELCGCQPDCLVCQ